MTKEWKQIEVDKGEFFPFPWLSPNLGRAEFIVCLKFRKGKVSEFWVYPTQTNLDTCWHYTGLVSDFMISSFQHLDDPKVWLVSWCREHRATTLSIYSPIEAKYIRIDSHGLGFWREKYD